MQSDWISVRAGTQVGRVEASAEEQHTAWGVGTSAKDKHQIVATSLEEGKTFGLKLNETKLFLNSFKLN